MFKEIQNIRQYDHEPFRRWFWSELLDLTVWYDLYDLPCGFQLCYKQGQETKALTYLDSKGYSHDTVDEGESPGGYKRTPILKPGGPFDKEAILDVFIGECAGIDRQLAEYVRMKLQVFPD